MSLARPLRSQLRVMKIQRGIEPSDILFVRARFDQGDPLIFGVGSTEEECNGMLPLKTPELATFRRDKGTELVWRDNSGNEIRVEHLQLESL